MARKIGTEHGAEAIRQRLNIVDPGKKAYDKMFGEPSVTFEGTIRKLIEGHNEFIDRLTHIEARLAALENGDPPPPPPPPTQRLAPQTYNRGSSGQDARYCVNSPGVTQTGPDRFKDEGNFEYDSNGLCLGGRSGNPVSGLKPADEMDGRDACDPYTKDGITYPPYPPESYFV